MLFSNTLYDKFKLVEPPNFVPVSFSIQIVIFLAILVSDGTIPKYHICAKLT